MSNANTDLSKKIIANRHPVKDGDGWRYELTNLLGRDYLAVNIVDIKYTVGKDEKGKTITATGQGHAKTTQAEAADIAASMIAKDLDDGVLVLSDTWEKDNY